MVPVNVHPVSTLPVMLPRTAAALQIAGRVFTHTSVKGDTEPRVHPLVRDFLTGLPPTLRERYAARCAETVLVSDLLWGWDTERAAQGEETLTLAEARTRLTGARLTVYRVREPGDPTHGTFQPPCRSCLALLACLGVEVVR